MQSYLKTRFNGSCESLFHVLTSFDKKLDSKLRFYVNYLGLNNLTNKNQYPLLLIEKFLDGLDWAKRFTQLNLINAFYKRGFKKETNAKRLSEYNILNSNLQ